ncbi:tail fiber assembly protein [Utexia brackfieldae]|uniref:tail fiber assembly protein n=1 Tax=Utexia brackfieldae TaxID=3074108 RepID=UPI00370D3FDD
MSDMNYYFDENHPLRPFTISLEANINSLVPNNALRIKPEFKQGFWPCEYNGSWIQIDDYRNINLFMKKSGEQTEMKDLGKLPTHLTTIIPDCDFPVFDENLNKFVENQQAKTDHTILQNNKIKESELNQANQKIAVLQDIIDFDMQESDEDQQLKAWKKYRIQLTRIDINNLEISWPEKPE